MAIYFAGGEEDCFYPISGQVFATETTSGRYVANLSRGAMKITQGTSEIEGNFSTDITTGWIHMYMYQEVADSNVDDWIQIKKKNGNPAYRICLNSDGSWAVQKYSGAAWSADLAVTSGAVLSSAGAYIDIKIIVHASTGEIRIYKDGTEVLTYTGDTSIDNSSFGRIHFKGQTGATKEMNISQVIVASENTVGWKLATLYATGNGANTAWTGDYTAIDEFPLNVSDYIESDTAGQVETYTASDIDAAYSTYNVKAVVIAARAANDSGSTITDLQFALRTGGTNYFSSNSGLTKDGTDYSVQQIWETNPNTTAVWTQAEVNGAEIGVKSV